MSSTSFSGESEIMDCETASFSSSSASWSASHKEDVLFVALGKDWEECRSVLTWALKNLQGMKRICVLYVHQPAQKTPLGSNVTNIKTSSYAEGSLQAEDAHLPNTAHEHSHILLDIT